MRSKKILDLFCGAGGCSVGYHQAGFEVIGVDKKFQKHYPFTFIQADALDYLADHYAEFDFIHASPPCQKFSRTFNIQQNIAHEDLITPLRKLLNEVNAAYIIENVVGAPLLNPILLCGTMFGLNTIRHRLFEFRNISTDKISLPKCNHIKPTAKMGRKPDREKEYITVCGNFSDIAFAKEAMGINWMNSKELTQAIPPSYTKFIGKEILLKSTTALI